MIADHCDDSGSSTWYENDLQLAAQLGKALLERNIDLEAQVHSLQAAYNDQQSELNLLQRQLDALRAIDESRARACEEIDRTVHELEKANAQLSQQHRGDVQSIQSLKETVMKLEQRCDELEIQLNAEKLQKSETERGRRREPRRTRSVPGRDPNAKAREFIGLPSRATEQEAVAASFRIKLEVERARCRQLELELTSVLAENHDLTSQIREMEKTIEQSHSNVAVEEEVGAQASASVKESVYLCNECKKAVNKTLPFSEPFEHDLDELPKGTGRLVRLKNGGSAFGSRDSLYRIGLEPDDATPGREVCSAILAAGFQQVQSPEGEMHKTKDVGGGSLLAELEEQYRKLVVRYESLIDAKTTANAASATAVAKESTASSGRPHDLPLPAADPTAGHFDNGPPEYKRLFREIFETLRRSADLPASQHPSEN